jgi:hypothetical protein
LGFDFKSDETANDLLPGTRGNQFGRSLTKDDLAPLVAHYNPEFAGPSVGSERAPPGAA